MIKSLDSFNGFLENAQARGTVLSDGEAKLYMMQKGVGGSGRNPYMQSPAGGGSFNWSAPTPTTTNPKHAIAGPLLKPSEQWALSNPASSSGFGVGLNASANSVGGGFTIGTAGANVGGYNPNGSLSAGVTQYMANGQKPATSGGFSIRGNF